MDPIVTSYTIIMIVAAMICMVIIVYVWPNRRKNSETLPLLLLLVGITEWICAALLGILDPNLLHKIFWAKIEYIGVVSVPLAVLIFVLHHSGNQQWLSIRRLAWLAAIPAITLLLAWTNEFHGLIWARYIPYSQGGLAFSDKTYGPAFWVYWGYSYLLLLAATVLTVRAMLASPRIFRWQSVLVAVGILAPWAANLLYILHIDPIKNLDLTPLAFGITGVALAFGMFRWQLFDIKPFAQAAVITGMADGLMILDNQGRVLDVNPAAQAILSQQAQTLIGKPMEEIIANRLAPEERSRWMIEKGLEIRLLSGNEPRDYELSDSPFYEKGGSLGGRIIFLHDITKRKRLEESLREAQRKQVESLLHENEKRLASIYDTVGDVIYYLAVEPDKQYRFESVNSSFGKVTGLPAELVIGRKVNEIIPEPSLSLVLEKYHQAILEKTVVCWEETTGYPSGQLTGEASIAPVFDQAGNCTHLVGTVHDITGRKQAELKVQRLNRYLRAISDANQVIVRATDETDLLTRVCQCIVETAGYRFAWVGFAESDPPKMVSPAASYGFDDGYLETTIITWADDEHGHGPTGMAVRNGKTVIAQDLSSQPEYEPWRQNALRHGYAGSIAIPLISDGQCLGALTIYSADPQVFDAEEVKLLEELGMDLAFGVTSLRTRTARELAEQALRLSEDKFKYVFDYSVVGKSFTQPSGAMEVNQAFCDMLGYSRDELSHLNWQEITHPEDVELTQQMIDLLLSGEKDTVRFTKRFLHKNGSIVWADLGTALRRDLDKQPLYLVTSVNDITERRQAEMAVLASEQKLKSYIESAGDAIYVIEARTGRIQTCNERACHDLGYNKDELLQLSSQDIEFKLSASEVDTIHHELQPGEVTTIDGMHRRKDGSGFPVEIRLSSLAPAQPEFILAIVRDITERKQFEEKLQKSEARYQLIFENSGTANTIFDTGCCVILQNSQSQKLTSPADAMGKTALEVFGTEQGSIVHARMVRVLASGVPEVFETKFSMPAGERWIRSSYQPLLDEQQGLVGIQVISQDISPQKQAEELLRETSERLTHMLANSPTIIYALKVAGDQATPVWISENIQNVLGFRAEAAMQPAWWLEQVHPEDRQIVQASLEHLFDDFYQHEYHFLCKDGRIIWLHDEHRLLRNVDNTPREIIGAWTDITERKQAEESLRDYNIRLALDVVERTRELKDAQEKLVRQEKLAVLGQLAGGVGHELRNPLAVISNAIYYLKLVQPDADEKIRKYHNMIEHEVHNSEKIITDLLDFARAKSVDREPVALPELIQRVLERFPVPESIKTVLEIPADLPMVFADPRQIEQVLGNLTVNACQAMASTSSASLGAGGILTISANQEKELLAIAVKDTGSGITPENMQRLFEPLFTTKPKGIGLGLAVSRKLVEANGGRIEVQSEPGKGTTFTLYLPVNSR